ncbi:hypothetical protein ACVXG7_15045 [Enterobacter hormaechei]
MGNVVWGISPKWWKILHGIEIQDAASLPGGGFALPGLAFV